MYYFGGVVPLEYALVFKGGSISATGLEKQQKKQENVREMEYTFVPRFHAEQSLPKRCPLEFSLYEVNRWIDFG